MKRIPKILSKSKILLGRQCAKALYLKVHHPEREAPVSEDLQALFDQGLAVGEEARKHFSGGVLIDAAPWEFIPSVQKTKEFIDQGQTTLYEAAFLYKSYYARLDILKYSSQTQKWSIYEVKSSTRVKDHDIYDLALQSWIAHLSGLKLEKTYLVHLNSQCVFPDLKNLFTVEDVTEEVKEHYKNISQDVASLFEGLNKKQIPDIPIGIHCTNPYTCSFKDSCWKEAQVPELSILDISSFQKKWDFFEKGVLLVDDERLDGLNPSQQTMVECHKENKRFMNAKNLKTELSSWEFPLFFLDFETFSSPIPQYDQSSPYTQIPFQFSLHILRDSKSAPEHYEFLHDQKSDPRLPLIKKLLNWCETKGNIVAYYADFEIRVIKNLAQLSPSHAKKLLALVDRMKDPLPLIRKNVYDPQFQFKFGLKSVAPALLGDKGSYDKMEIQDGFAAQSIYKKFISCTDSKEKDQIKKNLLEYCKHDTYVLMELTQFLLKEASS